MRKRSHLPFTLFFNGEISAVVVPVFKKIFANNVWATEAEKLDGRSLRVIRI